MSLVNFHPSQKACVIETENSYLNQNEMGFATAKGTNDPPEVRNWTIHLIALVASMAALSSTLFSSS